MDIWEKLYLKAREEYHPEDVSPFLYTGFCMEGCSGVMNLCAERVAALNMYVNSGQTVIKRLRAK